MIYHPKAEELEGILEDAGVWYERAEHGEVFTSEEACAVRPEYSLDQGAKSLIIKAKIPHKGKKFVLLTVPGSKKADKKKVKAALGANDFRFASREEVSEITGGVKPGGIPPWGNLFGLETYADLGVMANEKIVFNAGDRCMSIAMKSEDYKVIVGPVVVDIAEE